MAVGMTEPGAGSALTDLTTRAILDGDHYVVNGRKRFISGGGHSELYMV
jgi:butyryl-CoA dehydrogenase